MAQHAIEYIGVERLRPWPKNARTHSRKQIRQIADSIEEFGFTNPVLIDREDMILAGHGRVLAAQLLGIVEIPCVRIETMTPDQKRAYVIADNKLALNAGWDDEILAEELQGLLDVDFDISVTGFTIAEVDKLVEDLAPEEPGDPDDDVIPTDDGPPRCRPGDIWQLGPHRLICGNALDPTTVVALMNGELSQHPTVKPVQMIVDAIKDVSERGGIVLDLFGGSGSTPIAAHKTGRRGYLCELDPVYCDRIICRWETHAKDDAELVACGLLAATGAEAAA